MGNIHFYSIDLAKRNLAKRKVRFALPTRAWIVKLDRLHAYPARLAADDRAIAGHLITLFRSRTRAGLCNIRSRVTPSTCQNLDYRHSDMVRLADPVAINRDGLALDSQIGETAEVLERRIQAEYDKALEQERSGNKAEAQVLGT